MPINYRRNIKINPVDLPENEEVAVGIIFPFNNSGVFFQSYTTKEQVKSNLINLLLTDRGERINELEFGVGIRRLIFEQDVDQSQLRARIEAGIEQYIPEIELMDLEIKKDPNSHILNIVISYRLLLDYDTDAIQLNFN
jgi:phage baseplate assembly protein W